MEIKIALAKPCRATVGFLRLLQDLHHPAMSSLGSISGSPFPALSSSASSGGSSGGAAQGLCELLELCLSFGWVETRPIAFSSGHPDRLSKDPPQQRCRQFLHTLRHCCKRWAEIESAGEGQGRPSRLSVPSLAPRATQSGCQRRRRQGLQCAPSLAKPEISRQPGALATCPMPRGAEQLCGADCRRKLPERRKELHEL